MMSYGLKEFDSFSFEGMSGDIFEMSTHQLAETIFDAFYFYCYHNKELSKELNVICSSKQLTEVYSEVFSYKNKFLPIKLPKKRSKYLENYRKDLSRLYNVSKDLKQDTYGMIKAAELFFGSTNQPVRMDMIHKFITSLKLASENEIQYACLQREADCETFIESSYQQNKENVTNFLNDIFNINLQFSYEVLIEKLAAFQKHHSEFLPQSRLDQFLTTVSKPSGSEKNNSLASTPNGKALKRSSSRLIKRRLSLSADKKPISSDKKSPINGEKMPRRESRVVVKTPVEDKKKASKSQKLDNKLRKIIQVVCSQENAFMKFFYTTSSNNQFLDELSSALLRIFYKGKELPSLVEPLSKLEIVSAESLSTIFRKNSIVTKVFSSLPLMTSGDFLNRVITPLIDKVLEHGTGSLEIDPMKMTDQSVNIEANRAFLISVCQDFVDRVVALSDSLNSEIRLASNVLYQSAATIFPGGGRIAIAGFFMLRFIVPGIVTPERVGLPNNVGHPSQKRALILIAKILQNLANAALFKKEEYMLPFNDFLTSNFNAVNAMYDRMGTDTVDISYNEGIVTDEQVAQDLKTIQDMLEKHKQGLTDFCKEGEFKKLVEESIRIP